MSLDQRERTMSFRRLRRGLVRLGSLALLIAPLGAPFAKATAQAADMTVFAAASLKNALDGAAAVYREKTGKILTVSYAGSSQLAKQIEAGAPADIFFSADLDWMDYLAKKDLIDPATRTTLLGNTLVLVAPSGSNAALDIVKDFPLADALGAQGKLAMASLDSVPAGKYGKAALKALGVWEDVEPHVAQADNVRAALAFVARGEAPFGIVYGTDAHAEPDVRIVGTFPTETHPPIVYPVARIAASTNPDAKAFLAWLRTQEARPSFEGQGFTILDGAG
jgi:molybdate transport system substrate-binding protein